MRNKSNIERAILVSNVHNKLAQNKPLKTPPSYCLTISVGQHSKHRLARPWVRVSQGYNKS